MKDTFELKKEEPYDTLQQELSAISTYANSSDLFRADRILKLSEALFKYKRFAFEPPSHLNEFLVQQELQALICAVHLDKPYVMFSAEDKPLTETVVRLLRLYYKHFPVEREPRTMAALLNGIYIKHFPGLNVNQVIDLPTPLPGPVATRLPMQRY
jgi:hypothetical protein